MKATNTKKPGDGFDFKRYRGIARDRAMIWVRESMTEHLNMLIEKAAASKDFDAMSRYQSYRRPLLVGIDRGAEAIAAGLSRDEAIEAAVEAAKAHADLAWGGELA